LHRIDRNSTLANLFHMGLQAIKFSINSRFRYRQVLSCGWKRNSDTLFIIAGGPSVNEMNRQQWDEVAHHDTLALSYGSLVPTRIDAFVCEFAPPALAPNQIALFRELSRRHALDEHKPLCIWKHPEKRTNLENLSLPVCAVQTLVVPALERTVLSRVTEVVTRFNLHKFFCIQSAGSISAMVMFARAFSYKNVVLVGVDLVDRRYFYENNPDYAHVGLQNPFLLDGQPDLQKTHQVASSFGDIEDFARRLEIAGGPEMKLYVSSASSGLSEYWPVYTFGGKGDA